VARAHLGGLADRGRVPGGLLEGLPRGEAGGLERVAPQRRRRPVLVQRAPRGPRRDGARARRRRVAEDRVVAGLVEGRVRRRRRGVLARADGDGEGLERRARGVQERARRRLGDAAVAERPRALGRLALVSTPSTSKNSSLRACRICSLLSGLKPKPSDNRGPPRRATGLWLTTRRPPPREPATLRAP
jgi:hypothetical protein